MSLQSLVHFYEPTSNDDVPNIRTIGWEKFVYKRDNHITEEITNVLKEYNSLADSLEHVFSPEKSKDLSKDNADAIIKAFEDQATKLLSDFIDSMADIKKRREEK